LDKTKKYVDRFGKLKDSKELVKDIRKTLSKEIENGKTLHEFEIATISNLLPETFEEAKTLIPTLNSFSEDKIQDLLDDLKNFQKFV
jgi:DNA-directed RNA polymerase II subunit RPB4